VLIASEAHPFATTGGLAEVVGALPGALARLGHRVTLILPRYRGIATEDAGAREEGSRDLQGGAELQLGHRRQVVRFVRRSGGDGVTVIFVDAPDLFDREGLYGNGDGDYADNAWRFALFSRAALEYLRLRGERPSAIHAHDWQAGLVPAYQKMLLSNDPVVGGVPAVFTIHNLAFQGLYPAAMLPEIGLPWDVMHVQGMEFWGQISYLKAGINFSERITTVSPAYAKEMLTPEMGFGFDGVLARRADDLHGILNGIDTARWNPASDPFVGAPFTADELSGKAKAKRMLLKKAGLPTSAAALRRPVIGMVARLTDQKGLDLFAAAADELMALDAAWVLMGNGERRYEDLWKELAASHPGRVSSTLRYDEALEHLIEAGGDIFLMPSRFEPCGLNQLHSLRYGTLPVVRATGGLDDTVIDRDAPGGGGTGFKFWNYTTEALLEALRRALETYRQPDEWQLMQRTAMRQDFSWDVSAREYVKVYRAAS